MKKLSLVIVLSAITILTFFTSSIEAKNNPSDSPLCSGQTGKAKGICTAAVAKGCHEEENQALKSCRMLEEKYEAEVGAPAPWTIRLTRIEIDHGNDGVIDAVYYHYYDLDGKLVRLEMDYDYDGNIDQAHIYTYDSDGKRIMNELDYDNDTTINFVSYFFYYPNGNLMEMASDYNNDGTIDYATYYTYRGHEFVASFRDLDYDGVYDSVTYRIHDVEGYRYETDDDYDGDIDSVMYLIYDAEGRLAEYRVDSDNDGDIDYTASYIYDLNGNTLEVRNDTDGNGSIDEVEYYIYE
jgi:hypothetical protein